MTSRGEKPVPPVVRMTLHKSGVGDDHFRSVLTMLSWQSGTKDFSSTALGNDNITSDSKAGPLRSLFAPA